MAFTPPARRAAPERAHGPAATPSPSPTQESVGHARAVEPGARRRPAIARGTAPAVPTTVPVVSSPAVPPTPDTLVPESGPNLSFLNPDRKALDELEAHNPQGVALAQEDARVKALRVMNAVRTLGPAIGAALALGGEDEQQAQRFVETMGLAHTLALDAASALDLDPTLNKNRWALNMLERVFVEGLTASMMQGRGPGHPGTSLARIVMQAATDRAMDKPEYHPLPTHLNVSLALMQAMGPVMFEQQAFDFHRDRDEDLRSLAKLLMDKASEAVLELVDPLTREEDRATVFQVLVDEGGKALAGCWKLEGGKLQATLQQKSQLEIDKMLSARPNGFPLDTVLEQFEQQFRRLKILAAQQVHPKTKNKPRTSPTR